MEILDSSILGVKNRSIDHHVMSKIEAFQGAWFPTRYDNKKPTGMVYNYIYILQWYACMYLCGYVGYVCMYCMYCMYCMSCMSCMYCKG